MGAWPTWFGPEDRPLFGWVHVPDDGRARAGVVLCPPLGTEGVCARWAFRMLAEQLAARGMLALRFDYDGTGDSAGGGDDPDRVAAWRASISTAVDAVRASGVGKVVVVGMRLGAFLAALGAEGDQPDALVLWDPCTSGRSYLRAQQALLALSRPVRPTDDGSVEAPGLVYDAATVEALTALDIADARMPLAPEVFVLVRPDRPADRALRQRLSMPHVTWGSADGQAGLVDVTPDNVVVPESTVDTVASWISEALDAAGARTVAVSPPVRHVAVLGGGDGRPVRERFVSLGDIGLFGILCQPEPSADGPTAVFLNCGSQDHTGPARLWVELAREWGAAGLRSLRVDLSGLGDSPVRPGQAPLLMYPPEAFDDLADIVRDASPDPGRLFMVGLCSGGYHAVEAGLQLGIGGVCLINPVLTAHPSELAGSSDSTSPLADDHLRSSRPKTVDPRRQASTATRRLVRALPAHDFFGSIVNRLPDPAWWVMKRTVMQQAPARALELMLERDVEAFVICREEDARTICRGEGRRMRRMTDSGRMQFEIMPGIDHELFGDDSRRRVRARITDHVINRYAPASMSGSASGAPGQQPPRAMTQ